MKTYISLIGAFLLITFSASPLFAQRGIAGWWEWRSPLDKQKRADLISIELKPKNGKIAGTFFYNEIDEHGDTESDGGVTAFIGTVAGTIVKIEFDPQAEEPGYAENVRYKRPKGRLPSTATLTLKDGKLVWTQTHGGLGKGIPKQFVLRRAR